MSFKFANSDNQSIDPTFENSLRPPEFGEFVGQGKKVDNLKTYIAGAIRRDEALDHVLLHGPPGLGKTTLANIIAREIGVGIKHTAGPIIEKKGDLTAILSDMEKGEVLFIDEIHRLKTSFEEILYKAMEDYQIDLVIGQGVGAKNVTIDISPFTLVGATTRAGLISSPMRDRFGISVHLDFYSADELCRIISRSAEILKIDMAADAALAIARRSRGTPRVANKLLKRVRDFAQVKGKGIIDVEIALYSFKALEIDEAGFDEVDRKILFAIMDKFAGGPVGLSTLATAVSEERDTIEDIYEPYLIQQGFMKISARGRLVTEKALRHFKRFKGGGQESLF